jgi:hypothetical protein
MQRGIGVPNQHLLWDQGKPRKTLIELAGRRTFRMQLTSSQQSGIKSANPSPYSLLLCFSFLSSSQQVTFFYNYLYVHTICISTKPYKTHVEGINAYVNKHAYKYTYICTRVFLRLSLHLGVYHSLENRMFYEVCCLSNNKDYVSQPDQTNQLTCKPHYEYTTTKLVLSSFRCKKKKHFSLHFPFVSFWPEKKKGCLPLHTVHDDMNHIW